MELIWVLIFIGITLGLLGLIGISTSPEAKAKAKGRRGEALVQRALSAKLPETSYRSLYDVTLPTPRGTTQIDHIVLSVHGIFVIETKNMTGWIFGDAESGQWTQVIHRKKSRMQNPLRQNYKHTKVVEALLGIDTAHIHNVVAFVGDAIPKTDMPENVVWGRRELTSHILSYRENVFTIEQIEELLTVLRDARLEVGRDTDRAHIAMLEKRHDPAQADLSRCPKCEGELVLRVAKKTGNEFLGCARFPACRGTRQL